MPTSTSKSIAELWWIKAKERNITLSEIKEYVKSNSAKISNRNSFDDNTLGALIDSVCEYLWKKNPNTQQEAVNWLVMHDNFLNDNFYSKMKSNTQNDQPLKKGDEVHVTIGEFEIDGKIIDLTKRGKQYKEADGTVVSVPAGSYLIEGENEYKQWLPGKWLKLIKKNESFAKGGSVDSARIYVVDPNLRDGDWLELSDYNSGGEVMDAIQELLDKWSEVSGVKREEYEIHDSDFFPESIFSKSMDEDDFDKYYEMYEIASDRNIPVMVIDEWMSDSGETSVDAAKDAFYGSYADKEDFARELVDQGVISDVSSNMEMTDTDRRIVAGEEADRLMDDSVDEDDLISEAGLNDELDELDKKSDRKEELESELDTAEDELRDLKNAESEAAEACDMDDSEENLDTLTARQEETSDKQAEIKKLKKEFDTLDGFNYDEEKTSLADQAKEKIRDEKYDEIYKELKDPVQYFVHDQGLYSIEDLAKQSFIRVDYESLASDLSHDYTFIEHEGKVYVFSDNYAKGGTIRSGKKSDPNSVIKSNLTKMKDWELQSNLKKFQKEKADGNYDERTEQAMALVMEEINRRQGEELKKTLPQRMFKADWVAIHAPALGHFPAKDLWLKYDSDNFTYEIYSSMEAKKPVGRIGEKNVLSNIENGHYVVKELESYGKGGALRDIELPGVNLWLRGFSMDANGNHVVKIGFPNDRAFSIQTNGNLPETNRIGKRIDKLSELSQDELKAIAHEVYGYVSEYGSVNQKSRVKKYSSFADGGLPSNYGDMTYSEVWNTWTSAQREHFLYDHLSEIRLVLKGTGKSFLRKDIPLYLNMKYGEIPTHISWVIRDHTKHDVRYAKGGSADIPDIVARAATETVTDIGQLSKQELSDLNKYVAKGFLIKGKGGPFPKEKTVYAIKGFDIKKDRHDSVNKMIDDVEALEGKTFTRGKTFAGGGLVGYMEKQAEAIIKHYLPGVEANEVIGRDYQKIGDYNVDTDIEGDGSKNVFINVYFGDKYKDEDQKITKNYNEYASFLEKLADKKRYYAEVLTNDEDETVMFKFSNPRTAKYEKGGSLKDAPKKAAEENAIYWGNKKMMWNKKEISMSKHDIKELKRVQEEINKYHPEFNHYLDVHANKDIADMSKAEGKKFLKGISREDLIDYMLTQDRDGDYSDIRSIAQNGKKQSKANLEKSFWAVWNEFYDENGNAY